MRRHIPVLVFLSVALMAPAGKFTYYVNPFIGTGAVEGGLSGNNYPGATVPFGMVQLSPDTDQAPDWYNASGYDYNDSVIHCFSHTRLSGTGASDLIDIALFPTTGNATSSRFSHHDEAASPGFYRVRLADEGIDAELTATTHVGVHRYTYPQGAQRNIILDLDHSANKGSWNRRVVQSQIRRTGPSRIEGYRVITGWAKLRKIYFVADFSEEITDLELTDGDTPRRGASVVNGCALKARIGFSSANRPVTVKVALSGVSAANAAMNMEAEAPHFDFDRYAADADASWDKELGRIEATGDPEKLTTFYTALYHTMIQPNTFSDVNGEYMTPVYTTGHVPEGDTQYTTFSLWDTYRGAHPLYSLLMPQLNASFVNSMLRHYKDYGYLPVWHLWGQDNYCMIGNHAIPVIADAVLRDIPGIDHDLAYEAVRNSSLQPHLNSPFDVWEHYGYMPGYPFTEGNAWQYYWYVPHDIPALITLTGGKKAFERKLDDFFSITDTSGVKNDNISGCIGQYAHGNEPSHHVAYLYNDAGAPAKAQALIARIMDEMYNNTSSGYAGNDDCGEMSAWYVFSAMGFYPVNPASGEYSLGTPLFDSCTLHLPEGRTFTITASRKSADRHLVKSVQLNGKRIDGHTVTYADIMNGGHLHFNM